jgi:hypothetical protein
MQRQRARSYRSLIRSVFHVDEDITEHVRGVVLIF